MLRPRVYVEKFDKVYEVVEIYFIRHEVKCYRNGYFKYVGFDEVEFNYNTGCKDIDNNDIYENDIVEFVHRLVKDPVRGIVKNNQVVVNDVMYLDIDDIRYYTSTSFKVVGNVYENKELLKNE